MAKTEMLKISDGYSNSIEERFCVSKSPHGVEKLINMQLINEKLLRLSAKWTSFYMTDMLILLEGMERMILVDRILEIDIYFRQSGIDWITCDEYGEVHKCLGKPDRYRGIAKLVYKDGNINLVWQEGNC